MRFEGKLGVPSLGTHEKHLGRWEARDKCCTKESGAGLDWNSRLHDQLPEQRHHLPLQLLKRAGKPESQFHILHNTVSGALQMEFDPFLPQICANKIPA